MSRRRDRGAVPDVAESQAGTGHHRKGHHVRHNLKAVDRGYGPLLIVLGLQCSAAVAGPIASHPLPGRAAASAPGDGAGLTGPREGPWGRGAARSPSGPEAIVRMGYPPRLPDVNGLGGAPAVPPPVPPATVAPSGPEPAGRPWVVEAPPARLRYTGPHRGRTSWPIPEPTSALLLIGGLIGGLLARRHARPSGS